MSSTSSPSPFSAAGDGVRVRLRVTPRGTVDRIGGLAAEVDGGVALRVTVTAVAADDKANVAVIKLLSRDWGVARSRIAILAGATDRHKTLLVAGDPAELLPRLEASVADRKTGSDRG